jgi:hypothetical protein
MEQYQFNEHNLKDIFKSVWGYTAAPYLFSAQNRLEKALFGKGKSENEYNFGEYGERREYSIHGDPFYANNNNGNEMFLPIWLIKPDQSEILLQNTVSSFNNRKNIVETPLVNGLGTVKEQISITDWDINVKGLIVSTDRDYPDREVQELKQLYDMEVTLGIRNARSSIVLENQEQVIIKSLVFPEIKGMMHIQAFEMELVSDIPFKLTID